MLIRVQMVGNGSINNPFRVPLPNFTMVLPTPSLTHAIVDIPITDIPPDVLKAGLAVDNVPTVGAVVAMPPQATIDAWLKHIKATYADHADAYDLKILGGIIP